MKVACIQPELLSDREKCYSEIEQLLKNLLNKHDECEIACLPEKWVPLVDDIPQNLQKERGDDYIFVKELANKHAINLLSGGIWEKRNNSKKPIITCYFFNKKGEEIGRQDKIHLYSYEKQYFEPGSLLNIFKLNNFSFSILICFDMAFYETPRLAAENGADLLFSPTQIGEDGMINWKIYLQARALENRIPVAACNTMGNMRERNFPGNSKIISFIKGYITPSKLKVVEAPKNSSGFVYDDIDLKFPRKLRKIRLKEKIDKNTISVRKIA
jgi:predicted amidohydrolase